MAFKVRITPRAKRDISEIRNYISQHNRPAAERIRQVLVHAIDMVAEHPQAGKEANEAGVRTILATPSQYRIFYRVVPRMVVILHVRHTARRKPDPTELI